MELRTARLILRELEDRDWAALHGCHSDPDVVRYESFDVHTAEQTRQYIRDAQLDRVLQPRTTFDLAASLAGSPALIGRAGLRITSEKQREGTLWFIFARAFWRQGYATEAARAILDFAFGELRLHRVFGDCDPRNLGSIGVMERLGMRREARLVENVFIKGEWCDSLIYGILDREWRPGDG